MASSDPSPGDEREVLAGLPNARPQRRSAKRDQATTKAKRATAPRASSTPKASAEAKATRKVPAAGYATPTEAASDAPKGADLFTTTIKAIGELAEIGVAAGGRAVKSALQRLPRP